MSYKLAGYAASALKRFSVLSVTDSVTGVGFILAGLISKHPGAWYLVLIIMSTDLLRFFAHGAWHRYNAHATAHWHNPNKDFNASIVCAIRFAGLCTMIALALHSLVIHSPSLDYDFWLNCIWYIVIIASVAETFRCIIHTMHKSDKSWLSGTDGRIGIPNWISITRMPISLLTAHIYATQSMGEHNNLIATIIVIVAIGTDGIDGILARATKSITKVGKYLDPLGDKLIFFPNAIALIYLIYQGSLQIDVNWVMPLTLICFIVAVARDILFVLWFFLKGRKMQASYGASWTDKVRMGAICVWLLATAIAVSTTGGVAIFMAYLSVVAIVGTAVLSVVSFFVDYARVKRQLT